jgi:hypothetical protein
MTSVSLFVWLLPLDLSGPGGPTSSYVTASIALRLSAAFKHHHQDKVGMIHIRNAVFWDVTSCGSC